MSISRPLMRPLRRVSLSVFVPAFLLTCCTLSSQKEQRGVRNIILVHGAWADGSGWRGVYDILAEDGYNISTVQEPAAWRNKPSWMLGGRGG